MIEPPIDANLQEINNGPYFPVKLHSVPRAGELIKLYSFLDAASGHDPVKYYQVVQVLHDLHDVSEKIPQAKHGCHAVSVIVKPMAELPLDHALS